MHACRSSTTAGPLSQRRQTIRPRCLGSCSARTYGSRRDSIYGFVHYHSRTHEALGIARGSARVRFGGNSGPVITVKAGDVAILPVGTGHQSFGASKDFLVVGAYPPRGRYDEYRGSEIERDRALKTIPKVVAATKDPVYGADPCANYGGGCNGNGPLRPNALRRPEPHADPQLAEIGAPSFGRKFRRWHRLHLPATSGLHPKRTIPDIRCTRTRRRGDRR